MRPVVLAALLILSAVPTASAELLYVAQTYDGAGDRWTNTSSEAYRNISFQFNPDFYDTSTYTDDSISNGMVSVRYVSDRGTFGAFVPSFLANNQQYQTRFVINGTDYLNYTTTLHKPQCIFALCNSALEVCHSFSYAGPTRGNGALITTVTGNRTCDGYTYGRAPDFILHSVAWKSLVTADRPDLTSRYPLVTLGPSYFVAGGTAVGTITVENWDSGQMQVTNFTNYTNSMTISTLAIDDSLESTTVKYDFLTWTNALIEGDRHANATGGNPSLFDDVMRRIFGAAQASLRFVFGIFPGGVEAADFIATLITIIIGLPTFAITIFLSNPAHFLLYHTVFFLAVGTIRYAASPSADISTVWMTTVDWLWRPLFRWVKAFALWTWDRLIQLGQLIVSNTAVLITVVAVAATAALLTILQ